MSLLLAQLCKSDIKYGINSNSSTMDITEKFDENKQLIMNLTHDEKNPYCLEIELFHSNYTEIALIQLLHNSVLQFFVNGRVLISIPLRLLIQFEKYTQMGNYYYINIPFQIFMGKSIPLFVLLYENCKRQKNLLFNLTNINHEIKSCGLIFESTDIDLGSRTMILSKRDEVFTSIIQTIELFIQIIPTPNAMMESYNLSNLNGIYKGFFIESNNIDNINKIEIVTTEFDHVLQCHNELGIKKRCKRITHNLLYFPMNHHSSYACNCPETLRGALNTDKFGLARLQLYFHHPNLDNIYIYFLKSDLFTY